MCIFNIQSFNIILLNFIIIVINFLYLVIIFGYLHLEFVVKIRQNVPL